MNAKLFDALEICLQALEKGETIDSALTRFPALADELRPILEASLQARTLAGAPVSDVVQRRGRAKLLQRAAELREAKRAPRKRTWLFTFRPAAVTFVLAIFMLTGTGLVRASNGSLPGDNLYPVKRTWEDVTLAFVPQTKRDHLELAYETERVDEINELIAEGRQETVSFTGYLTKQTDSQWTVAGVSVNITADTILPAEPVAVGAPLKVTGWTDAQGFLAAEKIETVAPGSLVPLIEPEIEQGNENEGEEDSLTATPSGRQPTPPVALATGIPISKLEGLVQNVSGKIWVINNQRVDVSGVISTMEPAPGVSVIVEGYYAEDGTFIAVQITFVDSLNENGSNANDNNNGDDGNDNRDDRNDDTNENRDSNGNGDGGGETDGRLQWNLR